MLLFRTLFILPFMAVLALAAPTSKGSSTVLGIPLASDLQNFFASVQPDLDNLELLIKGNNKNATYVGGLLSQVEVILTTVLNNVSLTHDVADLGVGANANSSIINLDSATGATVASLSSTVQKLVTGVNQIITALPPATKQVPAVSKLLASITPLLSSIVSKTGKLVPGLNVTVSSLGSSLSKLISSLF